MVSRDDLHRLVDSLPDEALQPVLQMLTKYQKWPPASNLPPELERLRGGKPGMLTSFMGGTSYSPTTRSGSSSQTHWEGDTLVVQTRHYHLGHLLDVTQNIRLNEEKQLIYKHKIIGPGGKSGEHEITFTLET